MNHVHLIAGRAGAEMNALDALVFPEYFGFDCAENRKSYFYDENWREFETDKAQSTHQT